MNKFKQLLASNNVMSSITISGIIATTLSGILATPEAYLKIKTKEKELDRHLTKKEIAKTVWKNYIPTVLTGTITLSSVIINNKNSVDKYTALATVYNLNNSYLKDYEKEVKNTIGKEASDSIRNKVLNSQREKREGNEISRDICKTGNGNVLLYDSLSGRYFYSSILSVEKAVNRLYRRATGELTVTLNDLYDELNIEPIKIGDQLGWSYNDQIECKFGSMIIDDDTPCIVVDFTRPRALEKLSW